MTSMRKTIVASTAVRMPTPRVMREGKRDVPFDPRRRMNKEMSKVKKVRPATVSFR